MSVHFVGNHVVDFDDADHARGIVYCHDELGRPSGGWDHGMLQYWDTYVRVDGDWCFERRKFLRWYMVDALERPYHGAGVGAGHDALTTNQLPEAFESWGALLGRGRRRPVRLEAPARSRCRTRRRGSVQHRARRPQRDLVAAVDRPAR